MTDPNDFDLDLVARCVTGAASAEERAAFQRWMAADPARPELVAQLQEVWERTGTLDHLAGEDDDVDFDARWRALRDAMPAVRAVPLRVAPGRTAGIPSHNRVAAYAAAAAAVIVVVTGAALMRGAGVSTAGSRASALSPVHEYVTPRGRRAEFRLADGTRVLLSVDSRLRVPADFGKRERGVELEGEAFFDVQHDAAKPFLVRTKHAVTQDLGTQFDVRAYPSDSTVQVVVAEGRVALTAEAGDRSSEHAGTAVQLVAGQLGRTTSAGEVTVRATGDADRYLAWTQGRLVFKETPLHEALPELSRWFDLRFELGDSTIGNRRLTGSFQNQPNDELLAALAMALDARPERRGRVVTFYPARSPQ